jgi:hypothetical protein
MHVIFVSECLSSRAPLIEFTASLPSLFYVQEMLVHMTQQSRTTNFGLRLWEQIVKFSTVKIHQANHRSTTVIHSGTHNCMEFNTKSRQKTRSPNCRRPEENLGRSSVMTCGERSSTLAIFTSRFFHAQTFETPEEPKTQSPEVNHDHTSTETCGSRSSTLGVFLREIFTLDV